MIKNPGAKPAALQYTNQGLNGDLEKKQKMNEIQKKKNGKYLRINVPTIPDDDHLIKKPFAY